VSGLVLDTGALMAMSIGMRTCRITLMLAAAHGAGLPIRLPAVVLAEWWGGTSEQRFKLSRVRTVAALVGVDEKTAMRAGIARHGVVRWTPSWLPLQRRTTARSSRAIRTT
jgi:hypothetical protein